MFRSSKWKPRHSFILLALASPGHCRPLASEAAPTWLPTSDLGLLCSHRPGPYPTGTPPSPQCNPITSLKVGGAWGLGFAAQHGSWPRPFFVFVSPPFRLCRALPMTVFFFPYKVTLCSAISDLDQILPCHTLSILSTLLILVGLLRTLRIGALKYSFVLFCLFSRESSSVTRSSLRFAVPFDTERERERERERDTPCNTRVLGPCIILHHDQSNKKRAQAARQTTGNPR